MRWNKHSESSLGLMGCSSALALPCFLQGVWTLEMWAGTLTVVFLSMKLRICFACLQGSTKVNSMIVWEGWVGHKAGLVQSCPLCLLVRLRNEEIFMLHIHILVHGDFPAGFPVIGSPEQDRCTGDSPLKGT